MGLHGKAREKLGGIAHDLVFQRLWKQDFASVKQTKLQHLGKYAPPLPYILYPYHDR
jgi:hypothetical protein